MFKRILVILSLLSLLSASTCFAAYDVFLKLDNIPGDSDDRYHLREIDIEQYSFNMPGSQIIAGKALNTSRVGPIRVVKRIDSSSTMLARYYFTGAVIPNATLTIRRAGGGPTPSATPTTVYNLTNVTIIGFETSVSSNEAIQLETITLSFTKIGINMTTLGPNGSLKSSPSVAYDVVSGKTW